MTPTDDLVLGTITKAYLDSRDFNGMPLRALVSEYTVEVKGVLRRLIENGQVDALFSSSSANPAIKRLGVDDRATQLTNLAANPERNHCFLYPSSEHLAEVVPADHLTNEPYKRLLALGEPQLGVRSFELSVLEKYRNDPRYKYSCDDMHGFISISDDYFDSTDVPDHHKILLETFGFAYDDSFNRAVASFLRYLADLSPEHQQYWKAHELGPEYRIHPDFFRTQILGEFPTQLPIFTAFIMEMETINRMASEMGRPAFFRDVPNESQRPRRFGFLVRPTQAELSEFVLTLDKLLSENINKQFFLADVVQEVEEVRPDGKVIVKAKGSLQILDEWLHKYFRPADPHPVDEAVATLRRVRRLRQRPAHAIEDDRFDHAIFRQQRKLVMEAYGAVRVVRLVLANHPACSNVEVHPFLLDGHISSY